jgi:hypothetical protein
LSPHLILGLFSLIVFVCFCLFLVLFLAPERAPEKTESEICETIAGLSLANTHAFDMLIGDSDYRVLRTKPELKAVSAKFRRDRRRIALLWLGELKKDVRLVWEFRRFLVRNGLPVTFREEAAIAFSGYFALLYLAAMSGIVFTCGPFVLAQTIRTARVPVERLSRLGAGLLARAPAAQKAQLELRWTKHVLAWNIG